MGNYTCECKDGFNGDGFSCEGIAGLINYNCLTSIQIGLIKKHQQSFQMWMSALTESPIVQLMPYVQMN